MDASKHTGAGIGRKGGAANALEYVFFKSTRGEWFGLHFSQNVSL
jgi:hypothetical protein